MLAILARGSKSSSLRAWSKNITRSFMKLPHNFQQLFVARSPKPWSHDSRSLQVACHFSSADAGELRLKKDKKSYTLTGLGFGV